MDINSTILYDKNQIKIGTLFSQGDQAWFTDNFGNERLSYNFKTKAMKFIPVYELDTLVMLDPKALETFFSLYGSTKIQFTLIVHAIEVYSKIINGLGYNFDPYGNVKNFNTGFMVSLKGHSKKIDITNVTTSLVEISKMLEKVKLTRSLKTCLGVWSTKDFTMLDLSVRVENFNEAYDLGEAMKQESIYNLKAKEEIKIQ